MIGSYRPSAIVLSPFLLLFLTIINFGCVSTSEFDSLRSTVANLQMQSATQKKEIETLRLRSEEQAKEIAKLRERFEGCLLYTSPSPRDS